MDLVRLQPRKVFVLNRNQSVAEIISILWGSIWSDFAEGRFVKSSNLICEVVRVQISDHEEGNPDSQIDTGLLFSSPSFSILYSLRIVQYDLSWL
jgi:hypothetical protein